MKQKSSQSIRLLGSALLASLLLTAGFAQAQTTTSDDVRNGVKLRGNGTVDDTQRGATAPTGTPVGVKLRGDGSVDDTQPGRTSTTTAWAARPTAVIDMPPKR